MDHILRSTSPTTSEFSESLKSSVEISLSPHHSHAPSPCSHSTLIRPFQARSRANPSIERHVLVSQQTRRAARRYAKRRLRLEQRLGSAALAIRDQRKAQRRELRFSIASVLKDSFMKRELKRAMKTKISPQSFQIIDTNKDTDTGSREDGERTLLIGRPGVEKAVDFDGFAGQIIIQDHLGAMRQASF